MPTLNNLRRNPVLTNVSKRYSNSSFIAEQVLPVVPVDEDAGFYYQYDKTNLKSLDTRIAPNSKAMTPEIEYNLTKVPYGPLEERKLKIFIDQDELKRSKPPLDPRIDATETVTESFLLTKELGAATLFQNPAAVTQNTTLSGTSQWSDFSNSSPFSDLVTGQQAIKQNGLKLPNTCIMSWEVWAVIQNHPDFLDRIKWTQRGQMTPDLFAALIGVEKVIISMAMYNTTKEGQTDSTLTPVWGKNIWLAYIDNAPGVKKLSAGYTLTLTDGRGVDSYVSNDPQGEYVRISDYYLQYLMATEVIYGIFAAVA